MFTNRGVLTEVGRRLLLGGRYLSGFSLLLALPHEVRCHLVGLSVPFLQGSILRLEISNFILTGFQLVQCLLVLLMGHQSPPQGFLLEGLSEPFGETVRFDVPEDCDELGHSALGDHRLDVGVRPKHVLHEQVVQEELYLTLGKPDSETL